MLINIKVFIFVAPDQLYPFRQKLSVLIQQNLGNVVLWNAGIQSTQTPFVLIEPLENTKNNFRAGPCCALILVGRQTLILQTPSSSFNVLHSEDSD